MNILIIDDDVFIQKTLSFDLLKEGHQVTIASDGEKALSMLNGKIDPQLIICDVMMPNFSGPSFILSLKKVLKRTPAIFIISGIKDGTDLLKKLEIKYDRYFQKPVDSKEFLAAIKDLAKETV